MTGYSIFWTEVDQVHRKAQFGQKKKRIAEYVSGQYKWVKYNNRGRNNKGGELQGRRFTEGLILA